MTTPIYDLTEWAAAQASPWVPHNISLRALEAAARGSVSDRDLTAPPGACADGACYLVDTPATGAWAGHDGDMAVAVGVNASNGWIFLTIATEGQLLWVEDEAIRLQYSEALSPMGWVELALGGIPDAPEDGTLYGRIDGTWEEITEGTGGGGGTSGPEELIANLAITGADGTFPVIDVTGFRSVRILYSLKKGGADGDISSASFRFNGNATEYYQKNLYDDLGAGGVSSDNQANNIAQGQIALVASRAAGSPRLQTSGFATFTGLDSATLNKGWVAHSEGYRTSSGGLFNYSVVGFWNVATPVTSITILEQFAIGSTIQVLGIRSDASVTAGTNIGASASARVRRVGGQVMVNDTNTVYVYTSAMFDAVGAFDAVNGRLKVPAGFNRAEVVVANQQTSDDPTVFLAYLYHHKNGGVTKTTVTMDSTQNAFFSGLGGSTGVLAVEPNDYFTMEVKMTPSLNLTSEMSIRLWNDNGGVTPPQGTAFPTGPVVNQRFYRTDRKIEYVWDGARWLSTDPHSLELFVMGGGTADGASVMNAYAGKYDIWVEDIVFAVLATGATGNWTAVVRKEIGGVGTDLASSGAYTNGARQVVTVNANLVVASTAEVFYMNMVKNSGGGTGYAWGAIRYRLIG